MIPFRWSSKPVGDTYQFCWSGKNGNDHARANWSTQKHVNVFWNNVKWQATGMDLLLFPVPTNCKETIILPVNGTVSIGELSRAFGGRWTEKIGRPNSIVITLDGKVEYFKTKLFSFQDLGENVKTSGLIMQLLLFAAARKTMLQQKENKKTKFARKDKDKYGQIEWEPTWPETKHEMGWLRNPTVG